jgi:hypothetical protein
MKKRSKFNFAIARARTCRRQVPGNLGGVCVHEPEAAHVLISVENRTRDFNASARTIVKNCGGLWTANSCGKDPMPVLLQERIELVDCGDFITRRRSACGIDNGDEVPHR